MKKLIILVVLLVSVLHTSFGQSYNTIDFAIDGRIPTGESPSIGLQIGASLTEKLNNFAVTGSINMRLDPSVSFDVFFGYGSFIKDKVFFPVGLAYQVYDGSGQLAIATNIRIVMSPNCSMFIPVRINPISMGVGVGVNVKI